MKTDLTGLTKEERRQIKSLDVFVRTVIKRRTITHVDSYLRENRPWKELLHLEEDLVADEQSELSPLERALKENGIAQVSSNITFFVEDAKLAKALADINPKYLQCLIASVLLDKDDEEIAREMDLSANTVRIYRGRGAAQARKKGGCSDEEA